MRAAVYARVSSTQQRDAHTIESQLRVVPEYVRRQGWELVETYVDDGKSAGAGKLEARTAFRRLQADAAAGRFDVVAVIALDRITRSDDLRERGEILGVFQRAGIAICEASSGAMHDLRSSDGALVATLRAWQAAKERESLIERIMRGHEQAALRGRKPRGATPYGLFWSRDRFDWSEHPEQAPIVREVFARVIAGESGAAVGRDLARRGVPSPRGGRWESSIWRLLSRSAYRGTWVVDARRGLSVPVPRLVDDETWYAAQAAMAASGLRGLRRTKHLYLCEGLATCGRPDCGGRLGIHREAARLAGSRGGYYRCEHRRRPDARGRCTLPMIRVEALDERVWAAVVTTLSQPRQDLVAALLGQTAATAEDAATWAADAAGYREQLDQLEQAEGEILDRFSRGQIAQRALDGHLRRTGARRALLERQIETAATAGARAGVDGASLVELSRQLDELRAALPLATPEERRAIVLRVVRGVSVGGLDDVEVTVTVGDEAALVGAPGLRVVA